MSTIPREELEEIFHTGMLNPTQWHAVRYEVDIDEATGLPDSLAITFRSQDNQKKVLKFSQPRFHNFGPLQIPIAQHLYVADLSSLGWGSQQHVEVGDWEEEQSTMFWASSVTEIHDI